MKQAKQLAVYAVAILLTACGAAPENPPEDIDPPEVSTTEAICACHVLEKNGMLRCIASCPAGQVCAGSYQVCQKP